MGAPHPHQGWKTGLRNTHLPARSTKLIMEVLVMFCPASFLVFWIKVMPTIVCARLRDKTQRNDKLIIRKTLQNQLMNILNNYSSNIFVSKNY